ncbi:MAG: hypothetical protein LJE59_12050 [Chromatiaceae bacterium]|nr:hypothetical protein [Chromatiaceae bacterium]
MHSKMDDRQLDAAGSNTSTTPRAMCQLLCVSLLIGAGAAQATASHQAGNLNFSTTGQSMWESGPATQFAGSRFVGTRWTDETLTCKLHEGFGNQGVMGKAVGAIGRKSIAEAML